jgi:hypothetical protein
MLLELGEAWRSPAGELTFFGQFRSGEDVRTWTMILKPVGGAWRLRTLFQASPRRRSRVIKRLAPVRSGQGVIDLQG